MDCIIRHGILYNRQQRVQNPATKVKKTKSYTNTIEPSDKTVQTCRPWYATKSLATHQLQYTDTQHYIQHT